MYLPGFVLEVDTPKDCIVFYAHINNKGNLHGLDYVQPKLSLYNAVSSDTPPSPVPVSTAWLSADWQEVTLACHSLK